MDQGQQNLAKQTILGRRGLILFLVLSNMFVPLSTDMYLPALPMMSQSFQAPLAVTNLTLSFFFLFYGLGIILWGPLSDKYGRKPCLLVGTLIYCGAGLACGLAADIYLLIAARVLQGIGAGAVTTISMAIVKDCFSGPRRETILAIIFTASGLAPLLAPLLGAQLLRIAEWRVIFYTLAAVGLLTFVFTLCYRETLPEQERYLGKAAGALRQLTGLIRERTFITLVLIFGIGNLPFMGYITLSSYIYEDYFQLSEQLYSYYFAANAAVSLFGPLVYLKVFRRLDRRLTASLFFLFGLFSGLALLFWGHFSPLAFLLCFIPFSLFCTASRTLSLNLTLDQHDGDSGTASSLINATGTLFGSLGTVLASLLGADSISGLALLIIIFSILPLVAWLLFLRSDWPCRGLKD